MKLIIELFCVLLLAIKYCASTSPSDLSHLEPDQKARYVEELAKRLNDNVFANRHKTINPQFEPNSRAAKQWPLQKGTDAFAVLLDEKGTVNVAGNTWTRTPVWQNRPTQGFVPVPGSLGLDKEDHAVIVQTIRSHPYLGKQDISIVETEQKADTRAKNAAPHAEMKLQKDYHDIRDYPRTFYGVPNSGQFHTNLPGSSNVYVGANKKVCDKCSDNLNIANMHNHNRDGESKRVENHLKPAEIGPLQKHFYPGGSYGNPTTGQFQQTLPGQKLITYPGYSQQKKPAINLSWNGLTSEPVPKPALAHLRPPANIFGASSSVTSTGNSPVAAPASAYFRGQVLSPPQKLEGQSSALRNFPVTASVAGNPQKLESFSYKSPRQSYLHVPTGNSATSGTQSTSQASRSSSSTAQKTQASRST